MNFSFHRQFEEKSTASGDTREHYPDHYYSSKKLLLSLQCYSILFWYMDTSVVSNAEKFQGFYLKSAFIIVRWSLVESGRAWTHIAT